MKEYLNVYPLFNVMKILVASLLFLLFIPIVGSTGILQSKDINLDIKQEGTITTSGVNEFTMNFLIYPKNDFYSEVSNINTYPDAVLENSSYVFHWDNPHALLEYSLRSEVSNSFKLKKIKNKIFSRVAK